ncbi:hypothetical protein H2202_007070 [Exophiala xenobiotica]|nr:hypothetical protein H2202_007070 [Exophiala xenobiotica]KAK5190597.1 hypothetical protein LTR92_009645 [Exophiala xenobiotica]KAK5205824.1 hypothetical protein LTR41_008506 [Exophiala xenobiotica]KAK5217030.1 hypothetical protein LTR72_010026 [Exophiala xenobiotica]KAK5225316.1 hypothetical protein LTR47_009378 [Exophiala xenobiotica]
MATQAEPKLKTIQIQTHLQSLIAITTRSELYTSVIPALTDAIAQIAEKLRQSQQVALVGSANAFGDDQLNVDLVAENLIRKALANCPSVVTASSEEDPVEKPASESNTATTCASDDGQSERYTVAFDPLDGSSIIGANWTVGTIIGIWDGNSALHKSPRESQVAAIIGVLGPRTTTIIALNIPGEPRICFEIGISGSGGDTTLVRPAIHFTSQPFKTRYFAPANLRAAAESAAYARLIDHYIQSKYTLRYSGGLVPDVVHMLVKGHGVYVSPVTGASKAKLRRLYELYPMALVVECAGGKAISTEDGKHILDHVLTDCDERAGIACGTAEEVDFVRSALLKEDTE